MKSIIKEIFYGNRGNAQTVEIGKNYRKAIEDLADIYEKLKDAIPEELKPEFEKLCGIFDDREAETAADNFIEGVKIGILLGVEACD